MRSREAAHWRTPGNDSSFIGDARENRSTRSSNSARFLVRRQSDHHVVSTNIRCTHFRDNPQLRDDFLPDFADSSNPPIFDTRNQARSNCCANHPAAQYHFHFDDVVTAFRIGMPTRMAAYAIATIIRCRCEIDAFDYMSTATIAKTASGFGRSLETPMTNGFFIPDGEVDEAGRRGRRQRRPRANHRRCGSRRAHSRLPERLAMHAHQRARPGDTMLHPIGMEAPRCLQDPCSSCAS